MNVKKAISFVRTFSDKNASSILTGLALAGFAATIVMCYKKAPKTKKILNNAKKKIQNLDRKAPSYQEQKKEIVVDTVKEVVPEVAPVAVMAVVTAGCILGNNKISKKRIALLTAGYNLARSNLEDLNREMRNILGDKKTTEIKDAVAEKRFKRRPKEIPQEVMCPSSSDGLVPCWDTYSGRPFRSNREKIGQAINQLSAECQQDMYVSLNDFYDLIGLRQIPMGDDLGWNTDDLMKGSLPITMTSVLSEDGIPCLAVDYDISVRDDFRSLH